MTDTYGMGWLADNPDFRDYGPEHEAIAGDIKKLKKIAAGPPKAGLAATADLRAWCSPIEDQGALGSCTANAGVGLVEYFERRAFNRYLDGSRLFLYKATRDMLGWTGDTGAYLRTTMGALRLFGVPPERYWQYSIPDFDKEPSSFCYAFAQNYQALKYYRLDPPGTAPAQIVDRVKQYIAAGLPSMFGFTVYSSYSQAQTTGAFPFPAPGESVAGGHAVVAVGYDDAKKIKNTNPGGPETTGAFLIRNSWGTGWGQAGYGWLPYEYVLKSVAEDWWSLIKEQWVDTGQFG